MILSRFQARLRFLGHRLKCNFKILVYIVSDPELLGLGDLPKNQLWLEFLLKVFFEVWYNIVW